MLINHFGTIPVLEFETRDELESMISNLTLALDRRDQPMPVLTLSRDVVEHILGCAICQQHNECDCSACRQET